mmetsp:Transcript_17413/g.48537  ORF Transcript_17413/g.48537 Transcript_17413/m.48537 type:complete len:221 (-) Transcript_17413:3504-4166(-)
MLHRPFRFLSPTQDGIKLVTLARQSCASDCKQTPPESPPQTPHTFPESGTPHTGEACFGGLSPSGPAPSRILCACTTASPCHPSRRHTFLLYKGGPPRPPTFARRPPAASRAASRPCTSSSPIHVPPPLLPRRPHRPPGRAKDTAAPCWWPSSRAARRSHAARAGKPRVPLQPRHHTHPLPGPPPPTDHRTPMPHTWSEGLQRRAGGQPARPPPAVSRQT